MDITASLLQLLLPCNFKIWTSKWVHKRQQLTRKAPLAANGPTAGAQLNTTPSTFSLGWRLNSLPRHTPTQHNNLLKVSQINLLWKHLFPIRAGPALVSRCVSNHTLCLQHWPREPYTSKTDWVDIETAPAIFSPWLTASGIPPNRANAQLYTWNATAFATRGPA